MAYTRLFPCLSNARGNGKPRTRIYVRFRLIFLHGIWSFVISEKQNSKVLYILWKSYQLFVTGRTSRNLNLPAGNIMSCLSYFLPLWKLCFANNHPAASFLPIIRNMAPCAIFVPINSSKVLQDDYKPPRIFLAPKGASVRNRESRKIRFCTM